MGKLARMLLETAFADRGLFLPVMCLDDPSPRGGAGSPGSCRIGSTRTGETLHSDCAFGISLGHPVKNGPVTVGSKGSHESTFLRRSGKIAYREAMGRRPGPGSMQHESRREKAKSA